MDTNTNASSSPPRRASAVILRWQGGAMIHAAELAAQATPAWLVPPADAQAVGAGGRQAAWFVDGDFGAGVLRGYRRGGLLARVNHDRYLWLGESRTRPFQEFRLLEEMRQSGLPVPPPLAAGYWRSGPWYRAALLTRRIPGAVPLAQRLEDGDALARAAAVVRRMHDAGFHHADLNAYNILFDQDGAPWLIDMDRGHHGLDESGRTANLARLRRSFVKVGGATGEPAWSRFVAAYAAARN